MQPARTPIEAEATIRDLQIADRDRVVRIDSSHRGTSEATYWAGVFDSFVTSAPEPDRVGLGAESEGRLVGYLFGEVRAFEFGSEPCGWIFAVGVAPDRMRSRVASELLQQACQRFRRLGVHKVRTMVDRTDIPLMSFFRSSGFVGGSFYQLELDLEDKR